MTYKIKFDSCNTTTHTCPFDIANGSVLTLISLSGIVLNILVITIVCKIHLPGKQKIFIVNLALADLLLALAGTQRGLGLISHKLFIGGPRASWYCVSYAFLMNFIGYINSMALLPITIERFVAIVLPFRLTRLLCKRNCVIMCVAFWMPSVMFLIAEVSCYLSNKPHMLQVFAKGIIMFMIPCCIIIFCYSIIFIVMIKKKIKTRRVLGISIVIVTTGVLSWLPTVVVHYSSLNLSRPASHILTITLFYVISITDPITYIAGYKGVQAYIRGKRHYRNLRRSELTGCGLEVVPRVAFQLKLGRLVEDSDVCQVISQGDTCRQPNTTETSTVCSNGSRTTGTLSQ